MPYGPTFLYSIFPPHKKIVYSRAEELEAFQNGWRDTPFSDIEIDAARLAAEVPVQEQFEPVLPEESQEDLTESQPNAERPDTTATDGQEGEKTARKRGRPRKQASEDLI